MAGDMDIFKELGADIKAMRDELAAMKKSADEHRFGLPDHSAADLVKLDALSKSVDAAAAAAKDAIGRADASDAALKAARAQIDALEKSFGDLKTAASIGRATAAALGEPDPLALGKIAAAVAKSAEDRGSLVGHKPGWDGICKAAESLFGANDGVVRIAKALGTTPASAGGAITPEEYFPEMLVDVLRARTVIARTPGITRMTLPTGLGRIPLVTGTTTAYFRAENAAGTHSQITVDDLSMTVHPLTILTSTSRELLRRARPSVLAIIQNDMVQEATRKADSAMLTGAASGAADPIKGLIASVDPADYIAWGGSTVPLVDAAIRDALVGMASDDIPESSRAWIMHPATRIKMMFLRQGDTYAYPEMRTSAPSLYGAPIIESTAALSDQIVYVEGSQWLDLATEQLEMATSEHGAYFEANQMAFRTNMSIGFSGKRPKGATAYFKGAVVIDGVAF